MLPSAPQRCVSLNISTIADPHETKVSKTRECVSNFYGNTQ